MDISSVLTDILVVLVAAKFAAEVAERIGVPAVVGEIIAGVIVGPSALNLVGGHDEVLRTLGEIGVILLLLEVGMEMDIGELGKVGRASLLVATVGVVCPLLLGLAAMEVVGEPFKVSLFVAAALTATSVGITARVFGDLGALATTEARVVLGAAVADDVMGLVVLTVVVRLATDGSVSVLSVAGIVAVAMAFLIVGGIVGLRVSGPLFRLVARWSRSTGTLVAMALAFTLAFSRLADSAKLAPIVGAFVAGLALTRSDQSDRIRRELAPVGHLFIPVFFLQIGIDADLGSFVRGAVLRDAAILLVVAVLGKLVSPVGAIGTAGDKLLIGLGMLPRGEVGLIFATIGLANHVLDDELYGALLLVVLVTTLITPQLLKWRYTKLRPTDAVLDAAADPEPPGGWLRADGGVIDLAARPPARLALGVALRAAIRVGREDPGPRLLEWLSMLPATAFRWDVDDLEALLDTIERGNARSWRFLDSVGALRAALPDVAEALRARRDDAFVIDQLEAYRFTGLERLRLMDADDPVAVEATRLLHPERLALALFLSEALQAEPDPVAAVRATVRRVGLDAVSEAEVSALVADNRLLWAAVHRAGGLEEAPVLQLASHLDTPERARGLYVVSALLGDHERWELARLRQLHELVQTALAHDELTGAEARDLIGRRRDAALRLTTDPDARRLIAEAPRAYVVRSAPELMVTHAELAARSDGGHGARAQVRPATEAGTWWVDVAARDRHGLLAHVTGALASRQLGILEAVVATWPSGVALESFRVMADRPPDGDELAAAISSAFGHELGSRPLPDAEVAFDAEASPWHTVCEVSAPDPPTLVCTLATAFAAAGADVVAASIASHDGIANDRFELVGRNGRKLTTAEEEAIIRFLAGGVAAERRWMRRRYVPASEVAVVG